MSSMIWRDAPATIQQVCRARPPKLLAFVLEIYFLQLTQTSEPTQQSERDMHFPSCV